MTIASGISLMLLSPGGNARAVLGVAAALRAVAATRRSVVPRRQRSSVIVRSACRSPLPYHRRHVPLAVQVGPRRNDQPRRSRRRLPAGRAVDATAIDGFLPGHAIHFDTSSGSTDGGRSPELFTDRALLVALRDTNDALLDIGGPIPGSTLSIGSIGRSWGLHGPRLINYGAAGQPDDRDRDRL